MELLCKSRFLSKYLARNLNFHVQNFVSTTVISSELKLRSTPYSPYSDPQLINHGINIIKNSLKVEEIYAKRILRKNPGFVHANENKVGRTLDLLLGNGVTLDRLTNLPWSLLIESEILNGQIKKARELLNIKEFVLALPFAKFPIKKILEFSYVWERDELIYEDFAKLYGNRIHYLAKYFQTDPIPIADMMCRVNQILTIYLPKIETIYKLISQVGITGDMLVKDPYVFLYNHETIIERLNQIKSDKLEEEIEEVRPWLLRCPYDVYSSFVERVKKENSLLNGYKDHEEFTRDVLKCSNDEYEYVIQKCPSIKRSNATRVNEIVQFLLSKKYTTQQIIECPRVFSFSVETIDSRLKELSSLTGKRVANLNRICKSSRLYNQTVNAFKKREIRTAKKASDKNSKGKK